jgi:hypothetical protein
MGSSAPLMRALFAALVLVERGKDIPLSNAGT